MCAAWSVRQPEPKLPPNLPPLLLVLHSVSHEENPAWLIPLAAQVIEYVKKCHVSGAAPIPSIAVSPGVARPPLVRGMFKNRAKVRL